MRRLFTKEFWLDATERATKTAAQFAIGAGLAEGVNAFDVDWQLAAGLALTGAVLSMLTSVASIRGGDAGTAGLTRHRA